MKRRPNKIRSLKNPKSLVNTAVMPLLQLSGTTGLLIIAAATLVLLSAVYPQSLGGLRTKTADVAAPVLNVVSMPLQKAAVFVRDVTGLAALQAENARLTAENTKLREWYQTALLLEAENRSLRDLMNVKVEQRHSFITARILSDSASTFAKSLLVAAGTSDGVRKGQAVIAGDGLIGRVVEAGEKTARILLISDINSRVPVIIEDSSQHAIFTGQNGVKGALLHLPAEINVNEGTRIITSGLGGIFPSGLPVGRIVKTGAGIEVEPFANFDRLTYVRIIDIPKDPNLREGALLNDAP